MADQEMTSPLAPSAVPPERANPTYEVKVAPDAPGGRGPLRFEEGIATDTAVPSDFMEGVMDGMIPAPGRSNHNANVYEKWPDQTTRERAHLGSAAWTEAPTFLNGFSEGAGPEAERAYVQVTRDGQHYNRSNPACVTD